MAIDISDPRYDDYAPNDDATPATVLPIIGDDDTTVEGWAAFVNGEQVTDTYSNRTAAAVAAEILGYNPWMTDEEIDEEHEALDHGDWPF